MKKIGLLLIAICLLVGLCGCSGEVPDTTQSSSADKNASEQWETQLSKIPSDRYEDYEINLRPLSATLYQNGEVISIDVTDERLVRLLNYFNNALFHNQCAYTQSYVSPADCGLDDAFRLELTYEPYGDVRPGAYENEPTKFDMIVVTNSSFDFMLIDHDTPISYGETTYPFLVAVYIPFEEKQGACLEMFGF